MRLPIGDWTLDPYGPYVGCMDGAAEMIETFLGWAAKYNIKVLLDVHAMKNSQNGFDNSGKTTAVHWINSTNFAHWEFNSANWMGQWNRTANKYDFIDEANMARSVK